MNKHCSKRYQKNYRFLLRFCYRLRLIKQQSLKKRIKILPSLGREAQKALPRVYSLGPIRHCLRPRRHCLGPIGPEGIAHGMFGRAQNALLGTERSVMGLQWVEHMDARLGPEGILQWARQSVVKTLVFRHCTVGG